MTGLFLTFEGPDGAGKTTQLRLLAQALKKHGLSVVTTREPGGTEISDHIRTILLHPEYKGMADATEVLLYAASRAQHVREKIVPALERGDIVLCDRYIDASVAYQSSGLGVDEEAVRSINAFASGGLQPHRTYMLDIPAETGRSRIVERAGRTAESLDRIEQRPIEYHRRVRAAFARIAEREPDRIVRVMADRSPEAIAAEIEADCLRFIREHRKE